MSVCERIVYQNLFITSEPENKIRNIKIKESSDQPVASVDDIKASVMGLRLGTISPLGMKKATSSQSLNSESCDSVAPPPSPIA